MSYSLLARTPLLSHTTKVHLELTLGLEYCADVPS